MNYKYHKSCSKGLFNIMRTIWSIHNVTCTSDLIKKSLLCVQHLLNSSVTCIFILPLFRDIDLSITCISTLPLFRPMMMFFMDSLLYSEQSSLSCLVIKVFSTINHWIGLNFLSLWVYPSPSLFPHIYGYFFQKVDFRVNLCTSVLVALSFSLSLILSK